MTWTALSFPLGTLLSSDQMTNLFNNFSAKANGDASAPANQLASMADDSIWRDQIQSLSVNTYTQVTTGSIKNYHLAVIVDEFSLRARDPVLGGEADRAEFNTDLRNGPLWFLPQVRGDVSDTSGTGDKGGVMMNRDAFTAPTTEYVPSVGANIGKSSSGFTQDAQIKSTSIEDTEALVRLFPT